MRECSSLLNLRTSDFQKMTGTRSTVHSEGRVAGETDTDVRSCRLGTSTRGTDDVGCSLRNSRPELRLPQVNLAGADPARRILGPTVQLRNSGSVPDLTSLTWDRSGLFRAVYWFGLGYSPDRTKHYIIFLPFFSRLEFLFHFLR